MAFLKDIMRKYSEGSMVMRFIYINIAVFIVLRLIGVIMFLFSIDLSTWLEFIELPSSLDKLLCKPWTLITYAFAHYDIFHILFNMLWLYWLGRIFLDYFTPKQFAGLYIYGALGGAALYLLSMNLLPAFADGYYNLLGASASVLAIVGAVAVYVPDYEVGLLFIGRIKLKWVAIITLLIDFLSMGTGNDGGHISHLGGAAVGALYSLMMRHGHDITSPLNAFIDWCVSLFKRHRKRGVGSPVGGRMHKRKDSASATAGRTPHAQERTGSTPHASSDSSAASRERELDEVLAKLKRSGYTALTEDERKLLFSFSKKNKN